MLATLPLALVELDSEMSSNFSSTSLPVACDDISHHSLGGPSHSYRRWDTEYIAKLCGDGPEVEVNLMVQPNCSPHAGTLVSIILAFAFARDLSQKSHLTPTVVIDFADNANAERQVIDGVVYQRGIRTTGDLDKYIHQYYNLLSTLFARYSIPYRTRMEGDLLAAPGVRGQILLSQYGQESPSLQLCMCSV